MEVVTHFVNDTVEFYKWSLTIAGESSLLLCLDQVTFLSIFESVNVYLSTHASTSYMAMKLTLFFSPPDKRVENWPMMSCPIPTLAISCLYLFFLWAGPRYMQDRQPYTLRKTLIVYNFSMVVLNFYIAKEV